MAILNKILIFTNIALFLGYYLLNRFASDGRGSEELFPNTIPNVSRIYHEEMTPAGKTFAIWGVIYFYQVAWMIYSVSTLFRSTPATNILSNNFYICYMMKLLCATVWLFVWTRQLLVVSLVSIGIGQIFICLTIYFACKDLHDYLTDNGRSVNTDVWCVRMLVQNGILFYGTWTLVATLINVAIVISYTLGHSTVVGSIISLSVLVGITIVWFLLENISFKAYCEFTFTSYVVLAIASGGILLKNLEKHTPIFGISLSLLLLSVIFLVARISIIGFRANRQSMIKA